MEYVISFEIIYHQTQSSDQSHFSISDNFERACPLDGSVLSRKKEALDGFQARK